MEKTSSNIANATLERNLSVYVTAATAAGVGLLATASPAEAKIVYTPANQELVYVGYNPIPFDINEDGVPDIIFSAGTAGYGNFIGVGPASGNGIVGAPGSAAALNWGVRIGPKNQFETQAELMAEWTACHSKCSSFGPWIGKHNAYLGVRFLISGQTHYGWVSLNTVDGEIITGYAYETIPNKPLLAGEKSGPVKVSAADRTEMLAPMKQPASLGLLARGVDGLAIWRREEKIARTKLV